MPLRGHKVRAYFIPAHGAVTKYCPNIKSWTADLRPDFFRARRALVGPDGGPTPAKGRGPFPAAIGGGLWGPVAAYRRRRGGGSGGKCAPATPRRRSAIGLVATAVGAAALWAAAYLIAPAGWSSFAPAAPPVARGPPGGVVVPCRRGLAAPLRSLVALGRCPPSSLVPRFGSPPAVALRGWAGPPGRVVSSQSVARGAGSVSARCGAGRGGPPWRCVFAGPGPPRACLLRRCGAVVVALFAPGSPPPRRPRRGLSGGARPSFG